MLYLLIDAGGTAFKCALYDPAAARLLPAWQIPVDSQGTAETIQAAWQHAASQAKRQAEAQEKRIGGVCVSTPGPFDFENGVSRMTHKFAAINGLPIRPWLQAVLADAPVSFLHDSTAFLLGVTDEASCSPAGVMLGTGFGFACMQKGRILVNAQRGPAYSLWNHPFRGGIVEDTISRRALRAAYRRMGGKDDADVREIALRARGGEQAAQRVFDELGCALGELLPPILHDLHCDALLLGGQISLSGDLFLPKLKQALSIPVACRAYPEAALQGAARFLTGGGAQNLEQVL